MRISIQEDLAQEGNVSVGRIIQTCHKFRIGCVKLRENSFGCLYPPAHALSGLFAAPQTGGVGFRPHSHVQPAGLPAEIHAAPARQRAGRRPQQRHSKRDQPPRRNALQPVHPQE